MLNKCSLQYNYGNSNSNAEIKICFRHLSDLQQKTINRQAKKQNAAFCIRIIQSTIINKEGRR